MLATKKKLVTIFGEQFGILVSTFFSFFCHQHRDVINNIVRDPILQFKKRQRRANEFPSSSHPQRNKQRLGY